jgi:serine protease Do
VEQVQQGSAADQAGLRGSDRSVTIQGQQIRVGGDVIVALDGQSVPTIEDLKAVLLQYEPGQRVTLTLLREGEEIQVDVTLGERPGLTP